MSVSVLFEVKVFGHDVSHHCSAYFDCAPTDMPSINVFHLRANVRCAADIERVTDQIQTRFWPSCMGTGQCGSGCTVLVLSIDIIDDHDDNSE